MTSGVADVVQQVTNALLVTLRKPVPEAGTGKQVGDHQAPKNPAFPYYVLYQVPGGAFWGAGLVDPEAGAVIRYVLRSVGYRRDQAQAAADRGRKVVLGRDQTGAFLSSITPPDGYAICGRVASEEAPPGVEPEGAPPEVFSISEGYSIVITPS